MPHKKVTQMESESGATEKDPDDTKKVKRGRATKGKKENGHENKDKKSAGRPKLNKEKKVRKASSKKYRKYIVHSDPQRVQDCFPLAITYMSEPKEASMEQIKQYLVQHYEGIEKEELKDTLAAGIDKKYWKKTETGDYSLLIGDLDGCKGKNYFREVINAIIATNNTKVCTYLLLKKYISDYHEEFGISVHPEKLRRATLRAEEKGIIRFVKGVGLAAQYELCEKFIPSPAILAGKDKPNDYENNTDVSTEQSSEDETVGLVEGRNVRGAAMKATARLSKSIHADDDAEEYKNYYEDSETDVSSDDSSIAEWKLNDPRYYQDAYVPRGTAIKQYSRQASEHSVNRLDPSVVRSGRRKKIKGRGRPAKGKAKKKTKKRRSRFYDSDSEENISDLSDVDEDDFKDKYVPTPSKSRGGERRRKEDSNEEEKKRSPRKGRKPKKMEENVSEEEESAEEVEEKSPKKDSKRNKDSREKKQSNKTGRKRTSKEDLDEESEEEVEYTPIKKSKKGNQNESSETKETKNTGKAKKKGKRSR